ncbi:3-phosphoinositide-dependent protein kinase 2-like [Cocos nucifera]|uniref:non-specific serine/threonine protein kinase n=1 Tax=Cocos nucifera TaxID=13894 RepID=A0A8K0MVL0_COCNU|nr:3-phosphoinositide-dependent protein kinase 2-like [Cocos nucifera]
MAVGGGGDEMEKDFEAKLRLQQQSPSPSPSQKVQRNNSIAFRAPQEQFTIDDFELGKIYGVGSYSKVVRAKKKDSGNIYALKIMDKKFIMKENKISYVKLERIVLDQLDHPGIIRLFFTFQDAYSLYEKACTFVGTAAYVPPEVLNSSPATFGNDLWALGCTMYQMLSGSSPFKDASEWLIFQRIIARDLKFPDYFSNQARDLIDKLLDTDPSKRPGAAPDGYAALKMHPFFKGIDWKNLRKTPAPKLAVELNVDEDDDAQDSTWNLAHVGGGLTHQHAIPDGNNGATSSSSETHSHMSRLASIDSFDSRWQEFLEPGENIVMISKLKKLQKLSNKKIQLILTDKPKLICVDPSKMMVKQNITWSNNPADLSVQVSNSSHFKICTPKKVMSFEDVKQRAWQWKKTIEGLQQR